MAHLTTNGYLCYYTITRISSTWCHWVSASVGPHLICHSGWRCLLIPSPPPPPLSLPEVARGPGWRAAPALRGRRPSGRHATSAQRTVTATTAAMTKVSVWPAAGRPSPAHSPSSPAPRVRLRLTVGKFFLKEDTTPPSLVEIFPRRFKVPHGQPVGGFTMFSF